MDTASYLKRIHYTGEIIPSLETLCKLQEAHLLAVPFENLDIQNKIPIDLAAVYNKIVLHQRGGFCYELNYLFYQLLHQLGFTVKMVSARVFDKDKGYGPEFDHLAIIATIGKDKYLADVGFGEFSLYPLKIEPGALLPDPAGIFSINIYDNNYFVVEKLTPTGHFMPEYLFSEQERSIDEFTGMCQYHQHSPASHFTQKRLCTLPTREGRITLTGNTLKQKIQDSLIERTLNNEEEVKQVLKELFGINAA